LWEKKEKKKTILAGKKEKKCKTKIKEKKTKQNSAGFEQYHCHGILIKYS